MERDTVDIERRGVKCALNEKKGRERKQATYVMKQTYFIMRIIKSIFSTTRQLIARAGAFCVSMRAVFQIPGKKIWEKASENSRSDRPSLMSSRARMRIRRG